MRMPDLLALGNECVAAAACCRHLLEEEAVGCRPDPDGEEPCTRPRRSRISATISASLLTAPSVMNTICRRKSTGGGVANVSSSGDFISVPPLARSEPMKRLASTRLVSFTACGAPKRLEALSLESDVTLNRSFVVEAVHTLSCRAARACSIEGPYMDPEVSMMKMTSRCSYARLAVSVGRNRR